MLAFLAYASWGLLSPVGKRLLEDFGPLTLNAIRFGLALLVLVPVLGFGATRRAFAMLRDWRLFAVQLVSHVSLTFFLYSLVLLEPTFATLGFYTAPLWTALLARLVLGERMGWLFLPAAAGLMAGGYLALFGWSAPGGVELAGVSLAFGSAVTWAVFTIGVRKAAPAMGLRAFTMTGFLVGAPYYGLLALAFEGRSGWISPDAASWGWMALHVAVPTVAAILLFNAALQRSSAGPVNILIAAELAFTVVFSWLLFGDRFTLVQLGGLGLALAAVSAYLALQSRRTPASGQPPVPQAPDL
jgi:drug/metabolite transporter, DME family